MENVYEINKCLVYNLDHLLQIIFINLLKGIHLVMVIMQNQINLVISLVQVQVFLKQQKLIIVKFLIPWVMAARLVFMDGFPKIRVVSLFPHYVMGIIYKLDSALLAQIN